MPDGNDDDVVHPNYRGDNLRPLSISVPEEDIDDGATASTEDLVGLAMDASLGDDDDDEEEMEDERILYPQMTASSSSMCVCLPTFPVLSRIYINANSF